MLKKMVNLYDKGDLKWLTSMTMTIENVESIRKRYGEMDVEDLREIGRMIASDEFNFPDIENTEVVDIHKDPKKQGIRYRSHRSLYGKNTITYGIFLFSSLPLKSKPNLNG